jgi:glutamate-1-semialdehyde aminotransferase
MSHGALILGHGAIQVRNATQSIPGLLSEQLSERRIAHSISGEGEMFNLFFTDHEIKNYKDTKRSDHGLRRILDLELIAKGIYLKPENRYYELPSRILKTMFS